MGADLFSNNKPWDLSLYELNRKPQQIITDDTEIAVKPRSLHSELMCPICLDMLRTTMTTKECLHRFCQECIITALRSGNKECPTCRKKLVSKRSLRPDPNFDMLISKIYPSREEYEAHQEKVNARLSKNVTSSFDDSLQAIKKNNKLKKNNANGVNQDSSMDDSGTQGHGKKLKTSHQEVNDSTKEVDMEDTEAEDSASSTTSYHDINQYQQEVELVFKPLTQEVDSPDGNLIYTRFLKTTTNATVDHLIKYLSMRYSLESNPNSCEKNQELKDGSNENSQFTIYVAAGPGEYQPLLGQTTLGQINEKFWRVNKPLELYFAYKMQTQA